MDIGTIQAYVYFAVTVLLVVFLYYYIWYVHSDKKRGEDYERYGRLALDDQLTDTPVQKREESSSQTKSGETPQNTPERKTR